MTALSDLDDLEFFAAVARSPSLTAAAREWGVTLSAVSKRLTRLEERLAAQLVRRSTRRLSLTEAGELYAAGARGLLQDRSDLEERVSRSSGRLRGSIALHSTMGLGRHHIAPLLREFTDAHPDIAVELTLSEHAFNIAGSGYDAAIRVGPPPDARLRLRRLHPNRRIVCAAPSYLEARGTPRSLADLADHNCLVIKENDADFGVWRFGTGPGDETAVRVSGDMAGNDGEVIVGWCLEGRGLMLRSAWHALPLIRSGRLVQVLPQVPTPPADVFAVTDATAFLPRRTRALLDHLAHGLAARLAEE
ncbi:LysR family transcriptional regulator [Nocardiopsis baichengensis]|uniref:LysR family transcriptional regulator n=1 Tax=Nocardiopsis baichengensis TaxID=280240 RepID=UPI0003486EAB|nr:LysR family transcriptional regulator [Nocardiopsis baichengensis]